MVRERFKSRYPQFQFGAYKGVVLRDHPENLPREFFMYIDQMVEREMEPAELEVMARIAYEMMTGQYTVSKPADTTVVDLSPSMYKTLE